MSEQFKLRKVRQSKESVGKYHVSLCFDEFSKNFFSTANWDNQVSRWTPDLKSDGSLEQIVNNPFGVAAIKDGILVCEQLSEGCGSEHHIALLSRDGKNRNTYLNTKQKSKDPRAVLPLSENKALSLWVPYGGDHRSVYMNNQHENILLFSAEVPENISCAALGNQKELYFVTYNYRNKENIIYKAEKPDYTKNQPLFNVETTSKVDAMSVHPSNGTLIFVSSDGVIHCYNEAGERIADMYNTGLNSKTSYALTFRQKGRLYVTGTDSPILEVTIEKTK